jgi:hypothetical protein
MRLILLLTLALSACSSPHVRCDKHLQPINAPAAKEPAAKEPAARDHTPSAESHP